MPVTCGDVNGVRTLVLSRPETLNAFNQELLHDLADALAAAADDPAVVVVILTGAGRAFSSGADMSELNQVAPMAGLESAVHTGRLENGTPFDDVVSALAMFPKPLLVAVNGVGVGFGVTILGFADLVFMSTEARLKCPFTSLGVPPEAASTYLLPRLIGRQNAAWLMMSSEWVPAQQALDMGLVWKLCPPDELMQTVREHADLLAARNAASLRMIKTAINAPLQDPVSSAHRLEMGQFAELMAHFYGANDP